MTEYAVAVLSPKFFEKEWTRRELEILVAEREGRILPIRFGLTQDQVSELAPALTNILSISESEAEIDDIVRRVVKAIGRTYREPPAPQPEPPVTYQATQYSPARWTIDWSKVGKTAARATICALLGAFGAGLSAKLIGNGQDVVLSTGIDAALWSAYCGLGVGCAFLVMAFFLSLGTALYCVRELGCAFVLGMPVGGVLLLGTAGLLFGAILYLFDWSIAMSAKTQVTAAGCVGATVGTIFALTWKRLLLG